MIPAAVLCWRIVVTKTRTHWLRVGAAAAVMITVVGALVVYDDRYNFDFADWRDDLALTAASAGSLYLLGWAQRHRSNKRHRTISIIGAIVGLVPVIATIATVLIFGESA
jgi:peptidoglycan/LPS O-acetylase OafA/YrhL